MIEKDLEGKKVTYKKYDRVELGENKHDYRWVDHEGIFLKFGVDYEEMDTGCGNFSTAIILLEDGSMDNVVVEHVKFNNLEN